MHPFLARLRRFFCNSPSREDLAFYWWFLKRGHRIWAVRLKEHVGSTRAGLIVARQDRLCRARLETWEPDVYHAWVAGDGPGGDTGALFDCPGVPLHDVLDTPTPEIP